MQRLQPAMAHLRYWRKSRDDSILAARRMQVNGK